MDDNDNLGWLAHNGNAGGRNTPPRFGARRSPRWSVLIRPTCSSSSSVMSCILSGCIHQGSRAASSPYTDHSISSQLISCRSLSMPLVDTMRSMKAVTFPLGLIFILSSGCVASFDQASTIKASNAQGGHVPAKLKAHLGQLEKMCTNMGATLENPWQAIQTADLNADGLPDYVVDQGQLVCRGARSLFSGSGGSQVDIFVSDQGRYRDAWSGGAFYSTVENDTVWLGLCGRYCGDASYRSRADAKCCERALAWDEGTATMELSSRVRSNDKR